MEPVSTTAAVIYILGRVGAWFNKNSKRQQLESAISERQKIAQKYGASSEVMMQSLGQLAQQRLGYTRKLLKRVARTARKVEPHRRPFDPSKGWFAGKSFDEVVHIVDKTDKILGRTINAIDEKVSLAMLSVVALQGIEYLDAHHVIEVPLLDDSLHQIFDLPDFGGDAISDVVGGILDTPLTDLLAGPLFVFGIWRMADNLGKAENYKQEAQAMRVEIRAVEESLNAIDRVNARAQRIAGQLDEASYRAFKTAWITDKLAAASQDRLDRRYTEALREFEAACREFYRLLNERLDVSGVAVNPPT